MLETIINDMNPEQMTDEQIYNFLSNYQVMLLLNENRWEENSIMAQRWEESIRKDLEENLRKDLEDVPELELKDRMQAGKNTARKIEQSAAYAEFQKIFPNDKKRSRELAVILFNLGYGVERHREERKASDGSVYYIETVPKPEYYLPSLKGLETAIGQLAKEPEVFPVQLPPIMPDDTFLYPQTKDFFELPSQLRKNPDQWKEGGHININDLQAKSETEIKVMAQYTFHFMEENGFITTKPITERHEDIQAVFHTAWARNMGYISRTRIWHMLHGYESRPSSKALDSLEEDIEFMQKVFYTRTVWGKRGNGKAQILEPGNDIYKIGEIEHFYMNEKIPFLMVAGKREVYNPETKKREVYYLPAEQPSYKLAQEKNEITEYKARTLWNPRTRDHDTCGQAIKMQLRKLHRMGKNRSKWRLKTNIYDKFPPEYVRKHRKDILEKLKYCIAEFQKEGLFLAPDARNSVAIDEKTGYFYLFRNKEQIKEYRAEMRRQKARKPSKKS